MRVSVYVASCLHKETPPEYLNKRKLLMSKLDQLEREPFLLINKFLLSQYSYLNISLLKEDFLGNTEHVRKGVA